MSTREQRVWMGGLVSLLALLAFGAGASAQPAVLGDANGDGCVSFADIDPFVALLGAEYQAHVEPIAWYAFDGNLMDHSGSANHGFARGSLTYGPGMVDQAGQFNGTDSYVALSEPLRVDGHDYTIAFWLRVAPEAANQHGYILHLRGAAGGPADRALVVALGEAAESSLCIEQSGQVLSAIPAAQICDGLWHHVAFTRTYASMQVNYYLDGAAVGSDVFTAPETVATETFAGAAVNGPTPDRVFAGELDALRIFDRVISSTEMNALALPTWKQRTPVSSPSGRYGHAMAYDSARHVTVLFGGWSGSVKNDTWEWTGAAWANASPPPPNSPPVGYNYGMAFDSARGVIVMFGGDDGVGHMYGDTWEYNGTAWTKVATKGPRPRDVTHLAYDSRRARTVLFGGSYWDGVWHCLNDTWEWNGTTRTWTEQSPPNPVPPARTGHGLAYDAGRGVTVLFGGGTWDAPYEFGDTWTWNGTDWTLKSTEGPAPRVADGFTYDAARGVTVLFGGSIHTGDFYHDTWEWDGNLWRQVALSSPPSNGGHLAYDTDRKTVVLFGGYPTQGQTWEYALSR